ncbi:PREDICTED: uncharacterized protein LOC108563353 [Nicrophorus vespilloides]|uniref:Uncharacterized protein LOC108563353 n=1 Tax=Nicrophorus vespilloides TaxID=110193 RepID=A0ABM1MSI0_NICVS|nr:PREDICTED: uncharacterized protein LOC108563353 [Nicrophorus vespilloides]
MCDLLTKDECKVILSNYLQDAALISYKVNPLSETIEGLVGEHYIVAVDFATSDDAPSNSQRFFLKVLNGNNSVIFELSQSLNAYGKEEFFYNYLQVEYQKRNIDISYAPKCYYCKPYKIVLEDLSVRQFTMRNKKLLFDVEHCKIALDTLAKFHCSSIIYEIKQSICLNDKFPGLLENKVFTSAENVASKWMRCSIDGLMQLIDHLSISETEKSRFKVEMEAAFQRACSERPTENHLSTVLHGDLWSNNFLFQYAEGKPKVAVLIDYQILKYGPPASDVVQMIRTNTRKGTRDKHFKELLDYYYSRFVGCLGSSGLEAEEIMSIGDFLAACEEVDCSVRLHALADRSVTFLSDELVGDTMGSEDSLRSFLYEDRGKCMVDSFLTHRDFREIIEEDLLDLKETLLKH